MAEGGTRHPNELNSRKRSLSESLTFPIDGRDNPPNFGARRSLLQGHRGTKGRTFSNSIGAKSGRSGFGAKDRIAVV